MPQLSRVAVLWDPATGPMQMKGVETAGKELNDFLACPLSHYPFYKRQGGPGWFRARRANNTCMASLSPAAMRLTKISSDEHTPAVAAIAGTEAAAAG
jgi:hypothetical protein